MTNPAPPLLVPVLVAALVALLVTLALLLISILCCQRRAMQVEHNRDSLLSVVRSEQPTRGPQNFPLPFDPIWELDRQRLMRVWQIFPKLVLPGTVSTRNAGGVSVVPGSVPAASFVTITF